MRDSDDESMPAVSILHGTSPGIVRRAEGVGLAVGLCRGARDRGGSPWLFGLARGYARWWVA